MTSAAAGAEATPDLDIEDILRQEGGASMQIGEVSIYHETYGSGPDVILVNNFFTVAPMWRAFTAELAQRNRLTAYDLRNQGASTFVDQPSWEQHLADLGGLIDGLQIERPVLVGTSISTLLCRDFAVQNPDRVGGLILVGPVVPIHGGGKRRAVNRTWMSILQHGGPTALWDQLWAMGLSAGWIELMGQAGYVGTREAFASLIAKPEALLANMATSDEASDDPELLGRLECPTLLIAGDCDFICGPSELEAMAAAIPTCETLLLPGVGHMPNWEATAAFEQAAQTFIEKCSPAT